MLLAPAERSKLIRNFKEADDTEWIHEVVVGFKHSQLGEVSEAMDHALGSPDEAVASNNSALSFGAKYPTTTALRLG